MAEKTGSLKREDDRDEPGWVGKAVMVASLLVTAVLFGYLAYEAVTEDGALPVARVEETLETEEGVYVRVVLYNPMERGLLSAEAEVRCSMPPPKATFQNVPVEGTRSSWVLCPSGTQDPRAVVVEWSPG